MSTHYFALIAALGAAASAGAQAPTIDTINVIGTTPLGTRFDPNQAAGHVQGANGDDLREQNALDLADFMKRSFGSVFVNDAQSNPLQPDVQYRGFVGSPLLGVPQGLAVYQDGVRLNEPFGDTVNWALIPESAIDSMYLLPGSNPLFGLNALGGAIAINTKDGFTSPGTHVEGSAGSWGRMRVEADTGGARNDDFGWFLAVSHLEEDGWRDFSPTDADQVFAKLSTKSDTSSVDASFTYASTDLIGNGASPADLLELDRKAVFTRPDRTQNEYGLLNVVGTERLSPSLTLSGNLYVRSSNIGTFNGDDSDFEECEDDDFICEIDGGEEALVLDANGEPIGAGDDLEGATVNRTATRQHSAGFALQAAWITPRNHFVVGAARDESSTGYNASTELGALDATRLAVGSGVFVGESFVELTAHTSNTGFFLADTVELGTRAALTLAGRYNRTTVQLEDQIDDDLTGDHGFDRFNPAIGLTVALGGHRSFYASYSEANRAPSPVELTCADEDAPCRLPNAFVSDPPLAQVVAKTIEAGMRGRYDHGGWHAGVFRTDNHDDILFISAGALTNQGFFSNVGTTRREGLELSLDGHAGDRIAWYANYTYVDATFRDALTVSSPNNPGAVAGEIEVAPGDRLPLIPARLLKTGLTYKTGESWRFGGDVLVSGGQYLRGDEANLAGKLGGYAVIDVRAEYRFNKKGSFLLSIDNLLDEEFETFGTYGNAEDVLGDSFDDPRFLGPGAPRAAAIGLRFDF